MSSKLLSSADLSGLTLKNRTVMAPMTRCRAIGNIPNDLIAEYYGQRTEAGLIITEGTSPSPNGLGYARIPGIFSKEQTEAWKKVTAAVHPKGTKIFVQLMHVGRVGHPANLIKGAEFVAPSAVAAKGQMWTDSSGMQDMPVPREMNAVDLENTKNEFVSASKNAVEAGFDGVELHSANGYLLEQFLNPGSNQRKDSYGGSIENRIRYVLETAEAVAAAIGKNRVGIRLSPYSTFNDMSSFAETEEQYVLLAEKLNALGIAYIHLADNTGGKAKSTFGKIRKAFKNTLILSVGYTKEKAEEDLASGAGDLIAFGKPFLSNPDLLTRFEKGKPLNDFDASTFYAADAKGYTDYPFLKD